ncbi:hypothetical protein ACFLUO_02850 [Chloroflexota bacterium]
MLVALSRYNLKLAVVKLLKETPRLMLAPVVVGIMALALYLLGMVPAYLQGPTGAYEYSSIEEAESALDFDISVPAYFPSYLAWPPAKITDQLEPVPMVQMLFLASNRSHEALLIYQIVSDREDLPVALPWLKTSLQEISVDINGNEGKMEAKGPTVSG